jgi:hypothetical protein
VVTIAIYGLGVGHEFVSDEWGYVESVHSLRSVSDLLSLVDPFAATRFLPMPYLVGYILYRLVGAAPSWWHATILAFHLVNAALVALLVQQLVRILGEKPQIASMLALGAFSYFSLNWRHYEAVSWYGGFSEPLSTCFRLLAWLSALLWVRRPKQIWFMLLCVLSFVAALLARENSITFPLEVGLLFVFLRFRGASPPARHVLLLFVLLILVSLVWATFYLHGVSVDPDSRVAGSSGLEIIRANPWELTLRTLQFMNGNFIWTGVVSRSIVLLTVELIAMLGLATVWALRRQYLLL